MCYSISADAITVLCFASVIFVAMPFAIAALVAATISMITAITAVVPIAVVVISVFFATAMPFLITRNILPVVPVVLNKVDTFSAGVVLAAVLAPMFGMAWGHAQVNRSTFILHSINDHWLTVKHLRLRIVADIKLAVEAGLPDGNRNANIGGHCLAAKGRNAERGDGSCD